MRDAVNSKNSILNAAEKLFAEKGFDGARVSEIADEAGVNKALIYYYFDSKEDILDSLFSILINQVITLFKNNILELDLENEDDFDIFLDILINHIENKRDILRVAMTESMKKTGKKSIIIKIAEMLISSEIETMRQIVLEKGIDFPGDEREILVAEFFTGVLPVVNYILFRDEFIENFNMTEREYKEYFLKAFKETHFAYHLRR